ncbi:MAG: Acyl carrier protein [Myxococcota bacterium]|nr:Acyl carrier protein [Myxococcota bacterium]
MNHSEYLQLFKTAVFEASGKSFDSVSPETVIADLGLDSVAVMEVVAALEEKLNITIPDDRLAHINTIGDLFRTLDMLKK